MITFDSLRNDLKALGVSSGDLLFLRISYKAIGRVEGGPKTFVDALLDVVGKEGTIVVTAFPSRYSSFTRLFYKYSFSNKLFLILYYQTRMLLFLLILLYHLR